MRRRRAIIYDDEDMILEMMRMYFEDRGYEVLTCQDPIVCPARDDRSPCTDRLACSDIILTDLRMPGLTGIERIQQQVLRRCPVPFANKAIITGNIFDPRLVPIAASGLRVMEKPLDLGELSAWLDDREAGMDLNAPLATVRKEMRYGNRIDLSYAVSSGSGDQTGVAVNTSRSGLCMRTSAPLNENDIVTVRMQEMPARQALVRWVRNPALGNYLAGLCFTGCS